MLPTPYVPRLAESRLEEAVADSPVVLIHGPRQCGKTTLALRVGERLGYEYFTLDDDVLRGGADADPIGFVADLPPKAIVDEIQKVPNLLSAMKVLVDRDRRPGRFILTGSANVLAVPRVAESLAGRMAILRLYPLAQAEMERVQPWFLDALFTATFAVRGSERLGRQLAERIVAGGYPAALARTTPGRRAAWYRDYVESIVQRDVRDLSRIMSLDTLPRLLALVASATACPLNVSDLAAPFQLSRPTIRDYLTLLESVFLAEELQPWLVNRMRRLVKMPKLHIGDTGVAAAILGLDATNLYGDRRAFGQLLETFVYQELRRQITGQHEAVRFNHFRDKDGYEVDIVLERGGREVAGVEVKAGSTVGGDDFRGLRKLASVAGPQFVAGVVLYDGEASVPFGEKLFAIPISTLWQ